MGMYDYLKYDKPLPDGHRESGEGYQFRDFECTLSDYAITDTGMLILETSRAHSAKLIAHIDYTGDIEIEASNGGAYLVAFEKSKLVNIQRIR